MWWFPIPGRQHSDLEVKVVRWAPTSTHLWPVCPFYGSWWSAPWGLEVMWNGRRFPNCHSWEFCLPVFLPDVPLRASVRCRAPLDVWSFYCPWIVVIPRALLILFFLNKRENKIPSLQSALGDLQMTGNIRSSNFRHYIKSCILVSGINYIVYDTH